MAIALGACKPSSPDANDGAPRVEVRLFAALPSAVLAAARPKPAFSALACDGWNLYAVSELGVGLTKRVANDDSAFDVIPDKPSLAAVTVAPSSVVAVGARGVIVRRAYDDPNWKPEASPVTTDLHGIAAITDWIVAVGAGGTIVAQRSAGPPQPWTRVASPTQQDLLAVSRCSSDGALTKLCAVGGQGTLLVGDATQSGIVFRTVATGTVRTLRAVTPGWRDSGPAHAVGDQGTIVAIDANGARVVPSGTTEDLLAVADGGIEQNKIEGLFSAVIAVGKRGTVVVQATGRKKVARFKQLRVPTTDELVAIVSHGDFGFFVAPRAGGFYMLGLDTDARHSFLPE